MSVPCTDRHNPPTAQQQIYTEEPNGSGEAVARPQRLIKKQPETPCIKTGNHVARPMQPGQTRDEIVLLKNIAGFSGFALCQLIESLIQVIDSK